MPQGTRTNMFDILDQQGNLVAVAHAYVDSHGRPIGMYDPKSLLIGRTVYFWTEPDQPYDGAL